MSEHVTQLAPAAKQAIIVGAGTAQAGGLWAWFGTYNKEIGAICACIGAGCALYGVIRAELDKRRDSDGD